MEKLNNITTEKQQASAILYKNDKISIIILPYEYNKPQILLKTNESIWRVCRTSGSSSGGGRYSDTFYDFLSDSKYNDYTLYREENNCFLKTPFGFEFLLIDKNINWDDDAQLLPDIEIVSHIAQTKDKETTYILTHRQFGYKREFYKIDKNNTFIKYNNDDFKIVVYRDGGTTIITFNDGILTFPTSFNKELPTTLKDLNDNETIVDKINIEDIGDKLKNTLDIYNIKLKSL